ncbi:type IV pilin protein [Rugamonas sp. CCM 8940]|uniref:type IV pilin protein n=1 Tax=Rugamonas sp. CCM 8940 TaxID=2765359 RepID=UPI0018F6D2E0|nr:type IV pilin protein [Rugamonas sp. CCM 8940]MBJ7308822.1 prepilin-type N-terminal cleavage/methylation domain-containing protein [Rugamonas sp. CCM 8940]
MTERSGFTLVEMLVVLVILCVLAAQAVPSLHSFVVRTRRTEAQAVMLLLMQQQERFYSQHNRYSAFSSGSTDPEEKQFQWWSGVRAASSAYEIEGKACDGETIEQCVRLIAMPGTGQVDPQYKDEECGQLSLTSSGLRLATGASLRCWP